MYTLSVRSLPIRTATDLTSKYYTIYLRWTSKNRNSYMYLLIRDKYIKLTFNEANERRFSDNFIDGNYAGYETNSY